MGMLTLRRRFCSNARTCDGCRLCHTLLIFEGYLCPVHAPQVSPSERHSAKHVGQSHVVGCHGPAFKRLLQHVPEHSSIVGLSILIAVRFVGD